MKNIYLIYGEDTYRSRVKLNAIKQRYQQKFSDFELLELAGNVVNFPELEGKLLAQAMFVSRKLAIISDLMSQASRKLQDQLTRKLGDIPETTVVVFYEQGVPDRRSALFKQLNRPGFAEQYKLLTQLELVKWIESEIGHQGGTISRQAAEQLSAWFGPDTWRIHQELGKLLTANRTIDGELVVRLITPQLQGNIFELLDALAAGNRAVAAAKLNDLIVSGQPLLAVLSTIATSIRNLILVKESVAGNPYTTSFQIARKLELHPYVVQKALGSVRSISPGELLRKLETVQRIDQRVKTGRLEPGVGLEILVARLGGKH